MVGLLSTHHARPTHEISDDASQPRRAALGAAERVARDCDPLREDRLQLHGRPLPRRHPRLAQALTGPRPKLLRPGRSGLTRSYAANLPCAMEPPPASRNIHAKLRPAEHKRLVYLQWLL